MSGVALELRFEGTADGAAVERMLGRLAHRGPGRVHRASSGVVLGLACSPTLPEDADTPVTDLEKRAIAFDGRIDDRAEIEAWLEAPRNASDAELVLRAWARDGPSALTRIHGAFAFVLWDAPERRVVLARDRLGVKPLYFARTAAGLRAASEPHAMFVDAALHARPHLRALALALVEEPGPPGETLIEGVDALVPGHLLVARDGHVVVHRYGGLDPWRSTPARDLVQAADLLEGELRRAVRETMRARGRVAVWISGGLDSTTIAALAKRETDEADVEAPILVTTHYPGLGCDETRSAARVAAHLGLELLQVERPANAEAYAPRGPADLLHQPFEAVWAEMGRVLRPLGAVVHLMGLGSDESQWRTGFECETAIRESRWIDAAVHAGLHDDPFSLSAWRRLAKGAARNVYTSDVRERLHGFRWGEIESVPAWATERAAALIRDGRTARRAALRALRHPDIAKEVHAQWLVGGPAGPRMLEHLDILGASAGIEQRNPFFDLRVVELLLSLPTRLTSPRRLSKPVLRELARRHLPVEIAERPRKTTTQEFVRWALHLGAQRTRTLFSGSALERLGLARKGALAALADRPDEAHTLELTTAISLETWARAWGFT